MIFISSLEVDDKYVVDLVNASVGEMGHSFDGVCFTYNVNGEEVWGWLLNISEIAHQSWKEGTDIVDLISLDTIHELSHLFTPGMWLHRGTFCGKFVHMHRGNIMITKAMGTKALGDHFKWLLAKYEDWETYDPYIYSRLSPT